MADIDYPQLARAIADELRRDPIVPQWLSPAQVTVYTGIPEKTLAQYRRESTGPAYSRVGRHVRYRVADVDNWLRERRP